MGREKLTLRTKVIATALLGPLTIFSFKGGGWQRRRSIEKGHEIELRRNSLEMDKIDVSGKLPWTAENSKDWAYKPVRVKGHYDHSKEVRIHRSKTAERGYLCVTPFILSEDREGMLIYRGWLPHGLEDYPKPTEEIEIDGVLTEGEKITKMHLPNKIEENDWYTVDLRDLASFSELKNVDQSNKLILNMVDWDKSHRGKYPERKLPAEFMDFYLKPEDHMGYAYFWYSCMSIGALFHGYMWLLL